MMTKYLVVLVNIVMLIMELLPDIAKIGEG